MKIYDTFTKKKEEFKPLNAGKVSMYSCGPTVYNYAHIGNLRTYINADILRRVFIYSGYKVDEVMNITDIEDKIIKAAREQKVDFTDITKKYEDSFLTDLDKLNIEKPEHMPRATEEISGMIEVIDKLIKTGYAYKSEDGSIYFSIKNFKDYGKLAHLDFSGLKDGARVSQDEYDKENAQDFALWKAKKDGEPSWSAPFGEGRPGWHIECSAMSMRYLGKTIDIHAGAVDLIFPHHENEIAQSESYTGKKFVKYWFHPEHLMVDGKKMSKSLHNIYTLNDISEMFNVEPLAFRMLCLMSHYRDKLNFTKSSIIDAQNTLNNLRHFVLKIRLIIEQENRSKGSKNFSRDIKKSRNDFKKALDDDLSMPKAMATLFDLIRDFHRVKECSAKDAKVIYEYIIDIDRVLGLSLADIKVGKIADNIQKLAVDREDARKAGEYAKADKLRKDIEKSGYIIEDSEDGPILRKK